MSTVATVILWKERRMVSRLRMAGATSPEQARTLEELGISRGLVLRRLRERAVVRQAGADRFYLDEQSWNAVRRGRRRAIHVGGVIALIIVLAVLFARRVLTATEETQPQGKHSHRGNTEQIQPSRTEEHGDRAVSGHKQ